MIFHIPHASTEIPCEVRDQFVLSDNALANEMMLMTDWYTDELFSGAASQSDEIFKFPVSRLVVDPERFEDDANEPMSHVGMGAVYLKTSDGEALRRELTPAERDALIARYYTPHHQKLRGAVAGDLQQHGRSLIIDCHSFPNDPLPYEREQAPGRPDICLGTDEFHTPDELVETVKRGFESCGYRVAINQPFAGSLVPTAYYRQNQNVHSIMIEINRSLYIDEMTGEKRTCFADLQKMLWVIINTLQKKCFLLPRQAMS